MNLEHVQSALLSTSGRRFWVRTQPHPHEPQSAVVQLIQRVSQFFPNDSRALLRSVIQVNYPMSAMDRAMIRVAAKKAAERTEEWGDPEVGPAQLLDGFLLPDPFGSSDGVLTRLSDEKQGAAFLLELERDGIGKNEKDARPLHQKDRPVFAMLMGPQGNLLGIEQNRQSINRTFHAEVLLVQRWWSLNGRPLPAGSQVWTTLQCCRMCAEMIWHCAEKPESLRIRYLRPDPGALTKNRSWDRCVDAQTREPIEQILEP